MNQPGLGVDVGALIGSRASWEWVDIATLNGHRWRWDGFWPKGVAVPGDAGTGGDFGGLCLPPRVGLRRVGKKEIGVEVVGVVGGGMRGGEGLWGEG